MKTEYPGGVTVWVTILVPLLSLGTAVYMSAKGMWPEMLIPWQLLGMACVMLDKIPPKIPPKRIT